MKRFKKIIKLILNKFKTNRYNSSIVLEAVDISNSLKKWLGNKNYEKVSIGENCNSAWYLKETNNKKASYPFDWIFSSSEIVNHAINDNFNAFLDKEKIFTVNKNKGGHKIYHSSLFNHRNPLTSEENYNYYVRASERFNNLIKSEASILFVCTVIQEPQKRVSWAKGFDREIEIPNNQNIETFRSLIQNLKKRNSNCKFVFINQFTEYDPKIEFKIIDDTITWVDFYSKGKNSGVKYLDEYDDTIMKIIYKSFSQN